MRKLGGHPGGPYNRAVIDVAVVGGGPAGLLAAARLADAVLRARLGQAGRQRAVERFALDRMLAEFVRIVESVADVGG